MRSYWPLLRERLAVLRDVHRRGDLPLFIESFSVALVTPLLFRLPLQKLEALLAWGTERPRRGAPRDADAVAGTVLEMLKATRPIVRRGCLTRGFTLCYCLRRAGVDVSLAFGMGRVGMGDGFDGHCWLVLDGQPFLEPRDPCQSYRAMYAFTARRSSSSARAVTG